MIVRDVSDHAILMACTECPCRDILTGPDREAHAYIWADVHVRDHEQSAARTRAITASRVRAYRARQ
jgi:hypothetical protein